MTIERRNKEIIIRIPSSVGTAELQGIVDFISYKEATSNSRGKQSEVSKFASEVNRKWWKKNAKRFIDAAGR